MTLRVGEDIPHPLTPALLWFVLISLPDYLLILLFFLIQLRLCALWGSVAGPDVLIKLALASAGSRGTGSLNLFSWESSALGWEASRAWGFAPGQIPGFRVVRFMEALHLLPFSSAFFPCPCGLGSVSGEESPKCSGIPLGPGGEWGRTCWRTVMVGRLPLLMLNQRKHFSCRELFLLGHCDFEDA